MYLKHPKHKRPKTLYESAGPQQLQSQLHFNAKQCANPIPQPVVPDWRHEVAAHVILSNVPNHDLESVVWALHFRAWLECHKRSQCFMGDYGDKAPSLNKQSAGGEMSQLKGDPYAVGQAAL